MILPDSLHPLPVSDEERGLTHRPVEGEFVRESEVRQLLVGPLAVDRHPTRYHGHDGGFAGRVELQDSPFVRLAAEEATGDVALPFVGPAEAGPRHRAAPPRVGGRSSKPAGRRLWLVLVVVLAILGLIGLGVHVWSPSTAASPRTASPEGEHPAVPSLVVAGD